MRRKMRKLIEAKKRETEKLLEKMNWMSGTPTSPQAQRALEAEEKVLKVLNYFKKKKREFFDGKIIKNIISSPHFSSDDLKGIDFKIEFQNDEILPIQVKNYWTWQKEREYRKKGICLVSIWSNEDIEKTRERTFEAISLFLFRKEEIEGREEGKKGKIREPKEIETLSFLERLQVLSKRTFLKMFNLEGK